jgi:hypothetical protein
LLSYSGALHAKSLSKIPDPISNMLIMMKVKHFAGNKSPILSRIGEPTKKLSGRHGCHSVLLLYRPKSYLNLGTRKQKILGWSFDSGHTNMLQRLQGHEKAAIFSPI